MLTLRRLTFAAGDPAALARFWAEVVGYEVEPRGDRWAAVDQQRDGVELSFGLLPKSSTIEAPIHLDVNAPDRGAEVERLLALGARLVATRTEVVGELEETWTVLRDPEGNGFCVQGPDDRRSGPYVANVTFSSASTRRLGAFWSDALGWPEQVPPADFLQRLWDAGVDPAEREAYYSAKHPEGRPPRFLFQRREKSRPEHYPIHLDLASDDRQADVERLTAAGASVVETKNDAERTWTVLRDPEDNPFCVE